MYFVMPTTSKWLNKYISRMVSITLLVNSPYTVEDKYTFFVFHIHW